MKGFFALRLIGTFVTLMAVLQFSGCTDEVFTAESGPETEEIRSVVPPPMQSKYSKLRTPHLLDRAREEVLGASKTGSMETYYDLVVEYNENRITRRILDRYRITRRILDRYGDANIRARIGYGQIMTGVTFQVREAYLDSLLNYLDSDPDVAWIDPDVVMDAELPLFSPAGLNSQEVVPWNVDRIGARLSSLGSSTVHVIILDSGITEGDVEYDRGQDMTMLFRNRDQEYWDDTEVQEDLVFDPNNEGDMRDFAGHGTHIAGTIGARQNDEGVVGVAPGVRLHSIKVLDENGRTDITTTVAAVDLLTYIKTERPSTPMIVNMSLGTDIGTTTYNALDEAVARSVAAGVVFIVSAGNEGQDASTYSPAHVEGAITVGAFDRHDRFAPYSNYGSVIDILAPGTDIVSLPNEFAGTEELILMDGTSSAAAHVTGAAALYVSRHPDASPQEVRDALVNMSQAVIQNTPANTTNVSLFVGDGMRNERGDKAFSFRSAQWNASTATLTVGGEGRRLDPVLVRSALGAALDLTFVDYDATWSAEVTGLDAVPCAVLAESGGTLLAEEVSNAPDGCERAPKLLKAEWKNGALVVEALGTGGHAATLHSANTGMFLQNTSFDEDGELELILSGLPEVPCALRLSADGLDSELAVGNAPLNCDGNPYLSRAEWRNNALTVEVLGNPNATVTFSSANTGTVLTTATFDAAGRFSASLSSLPEAPCVLRAEMNGRTVDKAVANPPLNCDGLDYLDFSQAKWDRGNLILQGDALGADNSPTPTVRFYNAALGGYLGEATADGGEWTATLTGISLIPCAVRVELGEAAAERTVERAPLNCDGNAYVNLEKAKWDKGKLFLEGLGLPADNRPGATVTFTNAATGAALGTATLDDGEWAIQLPGLSVVPCTVRAELDGVTDDRPVERAPATCQ